nr:alpha/beta hydrolase [Longispora sp. (in: high G+C Gram-positive bacteria)]
DCPLAEGRATLDAFLAQLKTTPLPTTSGRKLTGSLARRALLAATYAPELWSSLREGLAEALHDGRGDVLLALADSYYNRSDDGGYDNSLAALLAVNCLVGDVDGRPSSPEALAEHAETAAKKAAQAPHFGAWGAYGGQVCSVWPATPTLKPHAIAAPGAPPILLVNTTRDNATPLEGAQKVARALEGSTLIVIDADGHIATGKGSCVDGAIQNFLFTGELPAKSEVWPAKETSCKAGD